MKTVSKYNVSKAASTTLTFATPIITLLSCGSFIRHRSETALSAAGMFVILLVLFFAKDKLAEKFKAPSALILSSVTLIFILLIEHIIVPMKTVCVATMIACGVDEITFKRWYKLIEAQLPKLAENYKHVGFLFTTTTKLMENNHE